MNGDRIPSVQLSAWIFAAVVPTAIQLTAGASWLSVLLAVLVCLLCVILRWRWGTTPSGKGYAVAMWVLMALLLGVLSRESIKCWPEGGHAAVPLMLLVLALWSTWKGPAASARVGCVLFWFILVLYLGILGGGVREVHLQWLKPAGRNISGLGCVLLLTPAAAAIHLNKREWIKPKLILIGVICVVAAVITIGVLSPQVSAAKENAFLEMNRSLTQLGRRRRLEAVLSAGSTIGWFVLMCLYLTICEKMAQILRPEWGHKGSGVAAALAAICVLYELHIPGILLLVSAAVFWVVIPLLTQGIAQIKKS